MILGSYAMTSGMAGWMKPGPYRPSMGKLAALGAYRMPSMVTLSKVKGLRGASLAKITSSPGSACGGRFDHCLSAASTSLLCGDYGSLSSMIPSVHRVCGVGCRCPTVPRASKDVPYSFRYPPMTKKPRWWWRTLACIPYLMPFHETWMYAETAYHLHPFLEDFEFFTYPFLGFIGRLPSWFLMAYFFAAYLGVVRKKMWPHFFRFHVVMGMLLEIALQVIGTISRWMPLAVYWGAWTIILDITLQCLWSVLCYFCGLISISHFPLTVVNQGGKRETSEQVLACMDAKMQYSSLTLLQKNELFVCST